MIVGIDEVGRGAWAGPLCIAAVGLGGTEIVGLTDSKKLSKKKRESYELQIKKVAPLVGIGWVSAAHIDRIGMSEALKLASRRAMAQIDCEDITQIIIDGTIMLLDDPRATTMKQADLLVPIVSAASIIAKVARDRYMEQIEHVFPGYCHGKHVGYGTSAHHDAIKTLGTTPLHRMSFSPMNGVIKSKKQPVKEKPRPEGAIAEDAAAMHLKSHGYKIIEQNWKTKWCEIDLIASKGNRVHFVEVKYRRVNSWGDGLSAITPKKLNQMSFAAKLWMSSHPYDLVSLSCLSLSGEDFRIEDHIEVII